MKIDDHTSLFGGFAYQDSSVSTYPTSDPILQDEYLSRVMPTNGFLGLRKELRNGKLWLEGVVRLAGKGDRLNTRDTRDTQRIPPGGTPSTGLLHSEQVGFSKITYYSQRQWKIFSMKNTAHMGQVRMNRELT